MLLAALAGVVVGVASWRPAFWYDEAVTVMVARRSWPDLLRLATGQEAPIGPYYLLIKPLVSVSTSEWWVRLPSQVAAVVTVYLLVRHARRISTVGAVATGACLLALPVFSRYAQEARPYALAGALAVSTTALWWKLRDSQKTRVGLGVTYAACVAALGLLQALALPVVVAQVFTAGLPLKGAVGRIRRTAGWPLLGLVIVAPYLFLAQGHVLGVSRPLPLTWGNWWAAFQQSIASTLVHPFASTPAFGVVLILALISLVDVGKAQVRPLLAQTWAWACLPILVLGAAAWLGRPTLVPRYAFVGLPAWALLAGWGTDALRRTCLCLTRLRPTATPFRRPWATPASVLVAAVPLAAVAIIGLPVQQAIRQSVGHESDVRPLIAWLRQPLQADRPVIVFPSTSQAAIRAYAPDVFGRAVLSRNPDRKGLLYLPDRTGDDATHRLEPYEEVIFLLPAPARDALRLGRFQRILDEFRPAGTVTADGWSAVVFRRTPVPR
jgi:mannosyltransferase